MRQQMYCLICKQRLLIHDILSESIKGMGSYFEVKCGNCDAPPQKVSSGPVLKVPGRGVKPFEINLKLPMGKWQLKNKKNLTH